MLFACILPLKRKKKLFILERETFMNWFLFYQKWNQVMSTEYLGTENQPVCFNCHLLCAEAKMLFLRSGHILCLLLFQKERETILFRC